MYCHDVVKFRHCFTFIAVNNDLRHGEKEISREEQDILKYIQQDEMLHSLFYLKSALHVSGGTITHHQERKQLYLQHLVFVTPPTAHSNQFQLFHDSGR
jgi:hypothetical protein